MKEPVRTSGELDLKATQARLKKLERREWFRWSAALVITFALTLGLLVLSFPGVGRGPMDQHQLDVAVRGLLAMVLLFDIFVIHQQILITRMRHDLTAQLNLIVALDLLKNSGENVESEGTNERRRMPRARLDAMLRVLTG